MLVHTSFEFEYLCLNYSLCKCMYFKAHKLLNVYVRSCKLNKHSFECFTNLHFTIYWLDLGDVNQLALFCLETSISRFSCKLVATYPYASMIISNNSYIIGSNKILYLQEP